MSSCPNCSQTIDSFSLSLSAFPLYFKCPCCKVRLKLLNSKPFWAAYCLYIAVMISVITYIPIIREFNLSVIFAVSGGLIVYYKILPYMLRKDNLAIAIYE
ncbi:hypothetical protein SAMN05216262_1032 [Colwellia chukchiensis]|uniref:Cxxc_20_cxxc protein n=1 Tax=Colwellia chukchiensis TaxID=641665 RepID=A0A1H7K306_9GAMM|nr:hypothetical protein SAMN05216262_1032 [Colwellia chukchiensis]